MRIQDRQTHTHTQRLKLHTPCLSLLFTIPHFYTVFTGVCVCVCFTAVFFFGKWFWPPGLFDTQSIVKMHNRHSACVCITVSVCVYLRACVCTGVCVCVCLQALLCECVCVCLCLLCAAGTELITVLLEILIHPEPTETHIHSQHRCLWWASVCVFMCVCSLWLSLIGANQLKAWDRSVSLANSCDQQTAAFCSPQE